MNGEPRAEGAGDLVTVVSRGQGVYYLVTGIWPLVSMRTFQWVTGPKYDRWLVKTVGVLIAVSGAVMVLAGQRNQVTPEIAMLATGSAAGLTGVDVVYVQRGRIRPIYLLDAVAEIGLIVAWAFAWRRHTR